MVVPALSSWLRRTLCEFHRNGKILASTTYSSPHSDLYPQFQRAPGRYRVRSHSTKTDDSQHVIRSPHADLDIPDTSLTDFMFSRFRTFGDRTAMTCAISGDTYTYNDVQDVAKRVASGLTKVGVKKGDRLLVLATNCPEYLITFLACSSIGAVLSTANPTYTAGELQRQLEHSGSAYVLTLPEFLPTLKHAIDGSDILSAQIKKTIVIGEAEGVMSFRTLMGDDGKAYPDDVDINSDDIITLPYSSGTTGLPKGVMLSHRNIIANILQTNDVMHFTPEDRLLLVLPLFHIYGMVVSQFCAASQGASFITIPRFKPQEFLRAIQDYKVTHLHLVPPLLLFMAKDPQVDDYDVSSINTIVCGAAPLGEDLTRQLVERVPAKIAQAYGLTESSPIICFDKPPSKMGTVGPIVANTKAKILDVTTGEPLSPGETGEVCIRGPQVMVGYLDNQEATDKTIKNGWLHTGDIGHFDESGRLVITDRLKELIKYKGFQVAPAELESVLLSHPGIQDAAVLGIPDEEAGEAPKAFVVLKPEQELNAQDIMDFVKERVASYKQLKGGIQFIDQIPKTASGKILRRQLKQL